MIQRRLAFLTSPIKLKRLRRSCCATGRQPGVTSSAGISPASNGSDEDLSRHGVKRQRPPGFDGGECEDADVADKGNVQSSSSAAKSQRPVSKKSRGKRLQLHSGGTSENLSVSGALQKVQKDTASLLEDLVKQHLFHLESLPLNEVMVYKKNPSRLKKALRRGHVGRF